MCIYIYIYIYIYIHTRTHTYIYIYIYIHTWISFLTVNFTIFAQRAQFCTIYILSSNWIWLLGILKFDSTLHSPVVHNSLINTACIKFLMCVRASAKQLIMSYKGRGVIKQQQQSDYICSQVTVVFVSECVCVCVREREKSIDWYTLLLHFLFFIGGCQMWCTVC